MKQCEPNDAQGPFARARCGALALLLLSATLVHLPAGAQSACGNGLPDPGEQCDDGNLVNGDGCSASCQLDGDGFDCTVASFGSPPISLIGDGSFEAFNADGDWNIIEHSLFGNLICGDSCYGSALASDLAGNLVSGSFILVSGGSFANPSTGIVEHQPIVLPADATVLSFNYGIATRAVTGNCPGIGDGLTLLIDDQPVWSSLDDAPGNACVAVPLYTVVDVALNAFGLNDGNAHVVRFEGVSSVGGETTPDPSDNDLTNIFLDQVRVFVQDPQGEPPVPSVCTPVVCGDGRFPQFSARGSEACDDGNLADGDGCSATCEIEQPDYTCVDPIPPAPSSNALADGDFELGRAASAWSESVVDGVVTLTETICSQATCAQFLSSRDALGNSGSWFAWFGRRLGPNVQFIEQSTPIPASNTQLEFALRVLNCDSASDTLRVFIDAVEVYALTCEPDVPFAFDEPYATISVDVAAFADDAVHSLRIGAESLASNGQSSNFLIDDVRLSDDQPFQGAPGTCSLLAQACTTPQEFTDGIPPDWTVLNLGPDQNDGWGTSDDGLCASRTWSLGNTQDNATSGRGPAACADSHATGQIDVDGGSPALQMDTYLCTGNLDVSGIDAPTLSLLANYQAADNTLNPNGTLTSDDDFDDDFLHVLIGFEPPTAATVPDYLPAIDVLDHLDLSLLESPRTVLNVALDQYGEAPELYACFHYRGTADWFAQIDNVALRGQACGAALDSDGDGVFDDADNCTQTPNSTQLDSDGDGHGNACDADFNNDCAVNAADLGIFRTLFFVPNSQADLDGDGITGIVDLGIFRVLFFGTPGPSAQGLCQ